MEGGHGQEIHSRSHHDNSWLGGEHVNLDQHGFSVKTLEVVEERENSSSTCQCGDTNRE